jgi:Flp pilus assembly pilin Flp
MTRVRHVIDRLCAGTDGQDLLEYAMLTALIALVALSAVRTLGQTVYDVLWSGIGTSI